MPDFVYSGIESSILNVINCQKIMKSLDVKLSRFLVVFLWFVIWVNSAESQIPLFDKITGKSAINDSLSTKNEISIENVNKEIEFTDNLILKRNISAVADEKQIELLQKIDSFNVYISKQGKEFRKFDPLQLSHYFLLNSKVNWQEYSSKLRDYQTDLQKIIRSLQEQQKHYLNNFKK